MYVPNGGKDFPAKMQFLGALEQFTAEMANDPTPLVICGDLNIARTDRDVHPKERKPTAIGQLPEERAQLERIIGNGLVDVGRALDPDNDGLFTWWAPWRNLRQRNIGWRLDYVLASQALFARGADLRGPGRCRHERPRSGRREFLRTISLAIAAVLGCQMKRKDRLRYQQRLRPERGAKPPSESERGWGPASLDD